MGKFDLSRIVGAGGVSESDTELREIFLDKIRENPENFYPPLPEDEAEALRESIQANGLLEPLLVVADGDTYRLVSGHNRFRALQDLRGNALGMAYKTALCRVLPAMDPDHEITVIIEANRQRRKKPALLVDEAKRLTESYIRRKQAGEDLPGRIRDWVAEALGVNSTKLANLSAIKNGLKDTQLIVWWETGAMPEAAALEAARMDTEEQEHLRLWLLGHYEKPTLANVRKFRVIWGGCRHECPEADGAFCPNAEIIYQEDFRDGVWHGGDCCARCLRRDTCEACCQYVKRKEPAQEAQEDLDSRIDRVQAEAETATADWQAEREAFGSRLRKAREATGLDRAAFVERIGAYKATYSAWENGSLPGSSQFPDLARALGVSTDYLYGLTEDPTPPGTKQTQPEGQLTIAGWMPGSCSPAEPGEFVVLVDVGPIKYFRTFMGWDGNGWLMLPSQQAAEISPSWWLRLPPTPEKGETV